MRNRLYIISRDNGRADEIAAVVGEPVVQGAAGIIVHPPGFLKGLEEICFRDTFDL
jgi:adenosylmethionine-8-amino-7-oxononanoate aminotransferase